ncbi:plasmid mobilization protein [Nitrospirillum bahiense]|uniref:Mobilization protein MobC n=2 Tax=Nitrospirillum amazonense TaxID=28077 RepID=A0A560FVW8_9PROT|nr:hypothetical protein [Nitrospirillum amazonense]TWB25630.1 hypothetical protein FBZ88_10927 [Nitrospirillum amazonense]
MARPKKDVGDRRRQTTIWLSDEERREIGQRAEAARQPFGDYVRRAALGRRLTAAPSIINLAGWEELSNLSINLREILLYAREWRDLDEAGLMGQIIEIQMQIERLGATLIGGGDPDA